MIRLTNTCQPSSTPHINAPHPHHRFLVSDTQIHTQTHARTLQREREREREASGYSALSRSDLCRPGQLPNVRHNTTQTSSSRNSNRGFFPRKNSASVKQINHHTLTNGFPLPSHHQIKQTNKTKKTTREPTKTTITTNSRDTYNAKQQTQRGTCQMVLEERERER